MLSSTSKGLKIFAAVSLLLLYGVSALSAVLPVAAVTPNTNSCSNTILVSTTLTANIGPCSGNGLVIGANGITLNCAGHTISGSGIDAGISLTGITTATVKNCKVTGFNYGFYLPGSSSNNLKGNTADSNTYGFYLTGSSKNTFTGNTVDSNTYGFYLAGSSKNKFTTNKADTNTYGFYLFASSSSNKLTGNTADSNIQYGDLDGTTGSGTLGTANTYSLDECSGNGAGGSVPSGLGTPQP